MAVSLFFRYSEGMIPKLALSAVVLLAGTGGAAAQERLILSGGLVADGSGAPPRQADVVIGSGLVEAVGSVQPGPADIVLDVSGRIVAPGFIDLHNHSQRGLLAEPGAASQVSQGITTLVIGPDGSSPFPVGDYLDRLETSPSAVNTAVLVGHGTLRSRILGEDFKRSATQAEIEAMSALVFNAMQQGAFGLSSGLEYDPGFYSTTNELVALAKAAARWGGIYMSHIRDEEEGFLEALDEAITIGREADLSVQVSHLKLGNRRVWGRTSEVLDKLGRARASGVDVMADAYPYNAWASGLSILVPSREFDSREAVRDGLDKVGGAEKVLITNFSPDPGLEFRTLAQISETSGADPVETYIELMRQGGADIVCESMSMQDVEALYQSPLVMVASDGGIDSRHPRKAGTFTRVLRHFVRERKLLALGEAIRKMTSLPASRLGLRYRGRLEPGYRADIVVFDPQTVSDTATFQQPDLLSTGIERVFVNGKLVWEDGKTTGALPGKILRHNR